MGRTVNPPIKDYIATVVVDVDREEEEELIYFDMTEEEMEKRTPLDKAHELAMMEFGGYLVLSVEEDF